MFDDDYSTPYTYESRSDGIDQYAPCWWEVILMLAVLTVPYWVIKIIII
jgi:hypothetical protein